MRVTAGGKGKKKNGGQPNKYGQKQEIETRGHIQMDAANPKGRFKQTVVQARVVVMLMFVGPT